MFSSKYPPKSSKKSLILASEAPSISNTITPKIKTPKSSTLPRKKYNTRKPSVPRKRPTFDTSIFNNLTIPASTTFKQESNLKIKEYDHMDLPNLGKVKITIDDLTINKEVGHGSYGTVYSVPIKKRDASGNFVIPEQSCKIAVKKLTVSNQENSWSQVLEREMCIKDMDNKFTVIYYGAIQYDNVIHICMELLDISVADFYKAAIGIGEYRNLGNYLISKEFENEFPSCVVKEPVNRLRNVKSMPNVSKFKNLDLVESVSVPHMPEPFIGKFLYCVITALRYVKNVTKKMHRDVKPSNILIKIENDYKNITFKLCDFGICGQLVNSVAKTKAIGCEAYFAPERINGDPKSGFKVHSDIWSLGVTTLEIANCVYPFNRGVKHRTSIFDLMDEFEQAQKSGKSHLSNLEYYTWKLLKFSRDALQLDSTKRPDYDQLINYEIYKSYSDETLSIIKCDSPDYQDFNLGLFIKNVWSRVS